jgi:hypothetical protein
MKSISARTFFMIFLLISATATTFAQHYKESQEIIVTTSDSLIKTFVKVTDDVIKTNISCTYYWYYAGTINANQGGFSGKLLHGRYEVYDRQQRLITSGTFKNGLKDGTFKRWNQNGWLKESCNYKKGKRNGASRIYNVSGDLLAELNYRNNLQDGISKYYLKDSVVIKKYRKGKEISPVHNKLFAAKKNHNHDSMTQKDSDNKKSISSKHRIQQLKSVSQSDNSIPQKK